MHQRVKEKKKNMHAYKNRATHVSVPRRILAMTKGLVREALSDLLPES